MQKMTMAQYRQMEGLNISSLVNILKSPKHFIYKKNNPTDSDSLSLGRAIHSLILEPDLFFSEYAIAPKCDRRTKEGKKIYEDFLVSSSGKEVISFDEHSLAKAVADSVLSSPKINNMLSKGQAEVSFFKEIDGVNHKARLDFVAEQFFLDVKTCQNCTAREFQRDFIKYNYHIKMGFYQHVLELETGVKHQAIVLAVETKDELDYQVYKIDQDFLDIGLKKYFELLETYKECVKNNEWPGLEKAVQTMYAPDWLVKDAMSIE